MTLASLIIPESEKDPNILSQKGTIIIEAMVFSNIEIPKEELAEFSRRNHIRKLALFGSVLRDDFGPESDIDIIVEFEEGFTPGLFKIFDMEEELSTIFGNRKVDLRTPADLSRYFRDNVITHSEVCYGT